MRYTVGNLPNSPLLTIMDATTGEPAVRGTGVKYFFSSRENADKTAKALNENDHDEKKDMSAETEKKGREKFTGTDAPKEKTLKPRRAKVAKDIARPDPAATVEKSGKVAMGSRVSYNGDVGTVTERAGIRSKVKFDKGGHGMILNRQLKIEVNEAPKAKPKGKAKSPEKVAQAA